MAARSPRQQPRYRNNNDSEMLSDEEEEFRRALDSVPPPTPPDGGWGWMVVFGSFVINAIVDGLCYSFGVILPEFVYHFNLNTSVDTAMLPDHILRLVPTDTRFKYPTTVVSLAGALLLGVYMISGPISSSLCNRFGSRRVALSGCLLSTVALFFSQFAHNTPVFLLLFGLVTGLGFGMMFMAALVIVGFYFEKRRSLAATLAMCGSGVGMAVMSPFVLHLLNEFEWKGCVALISGVVMQGFVLATLYRPLDADLRRRKKMILRRLEEDKKIGPQTCMIMQRLLEEKKRQRTVSTGSMNNVIITRENELLRPEELSEYRERKPSIISRLKSAIGRSKENVASTPSSRAVTPQIQHRPIPNIKVNGVDTPPSAGSPYSNRHVKLKPFPSNLLQDANSQGSVRSLQMAKSFQGESSDRGYHSVQDLPTSDDVSLSPSVGTASSIDSAAVEPPENIIKLYRNHTPDNDRPMYRKDILYSGSVTNLPQYNNNMDDYLASITQVPQDHGEDREHVEHGWCWHKLGCLPKSVRDVLRAIFDTSTFASPTYIVLFIASFLTMLGYFVPFVFLPVYSKSQGIESTDVALLLSVMGGANTFGRLLAGALGEKEWVDPLLVTNIALVIAGAAVFSLHWLTEHYQLLFFSAVYGLCVAAFSSLRSQIVVRLVGLDLLTTAFGQLIIINGLGVIIGTPMAGLLYDLTGCFDCGFYMAGVCIILSGVICLPLNWLSTKEQERKSLLTSSFNLSEEEIKKAMATSSLADVSSAESPF